MNTKILRVLFINPPALHLPRMEMSESVIEEMGFYPPLGLLYLATFLKEKCKYPVDVRIVDQGPEKIDIQGLKVLIKEWKPDIAAISTFTPNIVDALLTCKAVKEVDPAIKNVLGGHHVDSYPDQTLMYNCVDHICRGEGEESFTALVECLAEGKTPDDIEGVGYKENGEPVIDCDIPFIKDLDSIPLPDRSLINNELYSCTLGSEKVVATVMSSRGCPYQCTFCYCPTKNYRMRSTGSIITELREIEKMGIKEVFFFDDLFNVSAQRVIDLSKALLENKMKFIWSFRGRVNHITEEMLKIAKRSGCDRIHFGIETSSDDRLQRIKKNTTIDMIEKAIAMTRRSGITTIGNFMIGLPGETREDIFKTFSFMRKLKLDYVEISVLMPYPNTELYRTGLETGIIKTDFWKYFAHDPISRLAGLEPQVWTEKLPQEELFKLVNVGYTQFYMRPSYILRSLFKVRSVKEMASKMHAGVTLLKEILKSNKKSM